MPVAALKGLPMTKQPRKSIQDKASRPKLHKPNGRLLTIRDFRTEFPKPEKLWLPGAACDWKM